MDFVFDIFRSLLTCDTAQSCKSPRWATKKKSAMQSADEVAKELVQNGLTTEWAGRKERPLTTGVGRLKILY